MLCIEERPRFPSSTSFRNNIIRTKTESTFHHNPLQIVGGSVFMFTNDDNNDNNVNIDNIHFRAWRQSLLETYFSCILSLKTCSKHIFGNSKILSKPHRTEGCGKVEFLVCWCRRRIAVSDHEREYTFSGKFIELNAWILQNKNHVSDWWKIVQMCVSNASTFYNQHALEPRRVSIMSKSCWNRFF